MKKYAHIAVEGRRRTALIVAAFVVFSASLLSVWHVSKVAATSDPNFTGGTPVTNIKGQTSDITDLQLAGSGNPTVPLTLHVSNGSLQMTTTTGLTFTSATSGATLAFSGSLSDVNAALATLQYTRSSGIGTDTLEATLVGSNQVYDPDNGHVYELVTSTGSWNAAYAAALTHTYNGLTGYLATVTSASENAYLTARLPNGGWIGASDSAVEGQWKWIDGPENGTLFYTGNGGSGTGAMVSGQYSNWNSGEPNDSGSNEDCAQFLSGSTGKWNDLPCSGTTQPAYVVEYGGPGSVPTVVFKDVPITTVGPTDNVSSCAQLQTIGASSANAYDTINLSDNIDCTGQSVSPLFSGGFYGTFNGQGHTIKGFVLNNTNVYDGLFAQTNGATLENVILADGSITGGAYTGALVGYARNTTITGVTSDWSITGSNIYIGGLAGVLAETSAGNYSLSNLVVTGDVSAPHGYIGGLAGSITVDPGATLTIEHSYVAGSVTSSSNDVYAGGVTGQLLVYASSGAASTTIQDIYIRGALDAGADNYVGGLLGAAETGGSGGTNNASIIIRRSYVSGAVSGNSSVGGLVGTVFSPGTASDVFTIADSFVAGAVTSSVATTTGALLGGSSQSISSSDDYFDQTRTTQTACTGSASSSSISACTGVNTAGDQTRYFFDNHTNHPLDTWSFTSTWVSNGSDFPTFSAEGDGDGVADAVEAAAPNSGDANNDGVADTQEANVSSFVDSVSSRYVSIVAPSGCALSAVSTSGEAINSSADSSYSYPAGMVNYVADCGTPGYTATIQMYVYGLTGNLVLRKYDPSTDTYTTVPSATISQTTVGGQAAMLVSYQIADGGPLDTDGLVNGTIVDPVGLAVATSPASSGSLSDTGVNVLFASALAVGLVATAVMVNVRARPRLKSSHATSGKS